jgi:hypothetical protein
MCVLHTRHHQTTCCTQGGKLYLIIVYPNSRSTEVSGCACGLHTSLQCSFAPSKRSTPLDTPPPTHHQVRARCGLRGVPHLAAANRLDLEELASFDRDSGSSSSMLAGEEVAAAGRCGAHC